ncbi:hypothetical protein Emag_002711 [Eimeria magna]
MSRACILSISASHAPAASSLDPQATEKGFWGPLGPLLVSRASDFSPNDAANLALCLQRLKQQQQQQHQQQQQQQQDQHHQQQQEKERENDRMNWISDFFNELDERAAALKASARMQLLSGHRSSIETPSLPIRVLFLLQQQQQQQQDGETSVSPQDVVRLLQALGAFPRQQLRGRTLAAAEAAVELAAKNKHLYSIKQQKNVVDAVIQLGLKADGLKEWTVQHHKSCFSEEPVEVGASHEEHAEVYVHLDAENPMMKIRSARE